MIKLKAKAITMNKISYGIFSSQTLRNPAPCIFFTFILGLTNIVGKIWKKTLLIGSTSLTETLVFAKIFLFTFLLKYYRKCTRAQILRLNFIEFYIQTHQCHHHIYSNTRHSNTRIFSCALSYSTSYPEGTVFLIFITINSLMYSLILYK